MKPPIILGISGRKSCGKSSLSRSIRQHWRGVKPPYVPQVVEYGVADDFKRFCVDVLGLTEEQAFGSNEDKESLVEHLLWENHPVPVWTVVEAEIMEVGSPAHADAAMSDALREVLGRQMDPTYDLIWGPVEGLQNVRKTGPMKAREVMEEWALLVLKAFPRSAVNGVLANIRRDYDELLADSQIHRYMASTPSPRPAMIALVDSVRFPHDVEAIQEQGGVVLRLTRNPFDSKNACEVALDADRFEQGRFDLVHDNRDETPDETFQALAGWLKETGVL